MPRHEVTLGQLIDGGAIEIALGFPCGNHNNEGEGIPHIRPFNIQTNGKVSLEQIKSIPFDVAAKKPTLCQDDILFNNTNTKELVGKCALWEGNQKFVFSNHMTRIRIHDKKIINAYLNFAILHHWISGKSEMLARAHVAQASIIGERFREILLPWRNTHEQALIASLLSNIHRAISSQEKQIKTILELKSIVMRELFMRGLQSEEQQETPFGLAPVSWSLVKIGDFTSLTQYGLSVRGNPNGQYPILRMNCQNNGKVLYRDLQFVDLHSKTFATFQLDVGDVLFNRTNSFELVGRSAIVTQDIKAVFASYLVRIKVNRNIVNPDFFNHFLNWDITQSELKKLASRGVSQANISASKLKDFPIPIPALDEQQKIVNILDVIDQKIDLHNRRLTTLNELFKTLLHKLMTGEVRVSELDLSTLEKPTDALGDTA
jgi:type I restriction enzyme, S subunit